MNEEFSAELASLCADWNIPAVLLEGRALKPYTEAQELVLAEQGQDGREHFLQPAAARAWQAMQAEAAAGGIDLFIVSAFRSVARQQDIIRGKRERGLAWEAILAISALPGFSEHHTGYAIDVGTPGFANLEEEFERSAAFAWLMTEAAYFGFQLSYPRGNAQGFSYEPWHWCYSTEPVLPVQVV